MALPTTYSVGTATVNASGTVVTGHGTAWLTNGLQAGDMFWAAGLSVRIAAVNSNTSLTLASPWPGASRNADSYEARYSPELTRVSAATSQVLAALTNGVMYAFSALPTAANTFAYFTGAGTMALASLKAKGRQFLADDFYPVQQGGGVGQGDYKLRLGWNGSDKVVAQVDDVQLGGLWTDASATSGAGWFRLPSGVLFQQGSPVVTVSQFGTGIVTLPTAFQSASSYTVVLSNGDANINVQFQALAANGFPSAVQFAFQAVRPDGSYLPGGSVRLNFTAIGR